jgi:hypothetical protein
MKTPKLTIPEYRKRFIKLVEANMRLEREIESLKKSLAEENRRRTIALSELVELKRTK